MNVISALFVHWIILRISEAHMEKNTLKRSVVNALFAWVDISLNMNDNTLECLSVI